MSKLVNTERLNEILDYAKIHTDFETCQHFNIKPGTLERYRRENKSQNLPLDNLDKNKVLQKILDRYSEAELIAIAKGGRLVPGQAKVPIINFAGEHFKIGFITDTHIGSKYFREERLDAAFQEFDKANVDFVCHTGDVTEGLSRRPGHIYELDRIGYEEQKEYAINLLSRYDKKMYMIDGNHDRWYLENSNTGAVIVRDICRCLDNAEYLGHDEAILTVNGAVIMLWHGLDGNSYALSYRLQKIIEAFTGGEKPHILLAGHTHKAVYIFERHVHCYSGGSIQSQTPFMRGKRIAAHTGFWIIDITVNETGIAKCGGVWHPFYA